MNNQITIEVYDLEVDYQDAGPWRCYSFYSQGNTIEDLVINGVISEIDQDGGELDCYGLDDAPNDVIEAAIQLIAKEFNKEKI